MEGVWIENLFAVDFQRNCNVTGEDDKSPSDKNETVKKRYYY